VPHDTQRTTALASANAIRTGRKQLRDDVRAGRIQIRDLLDDTPPIVHGMTVMEVLMLAHGTNRYPSIRTRIGKDAAHARINLYQPVERASDLTRGWAARHVPAIRTRHENRVAA
jgi:hypothetical protein